MSVPLPAGKGEGAEVDRDDFLWKGCLNSGALVTTVLLLDDDRDFRVLLTSSLAPNGFEVLEADTAAQADQLLSRTSAIDLAVVDGLLPDGLGVEYIRRLRQRDKKIRIVFVSALLRDLQTFRQLTGELDVSLVVYKPIDPTSFVAKLQALCPEKAVSSRPKLQPQLGELRTQFAQRLPERLTQLLEVLQAARTDSARLVEARTLAHRLRGSAGSYGYPDVGEAMGCVEDCLLEADAQQLMPRDFLWQKIDTSMRDARAATQRAPEPERLEGVGQTSKALLVVDDDILFLQQATSACRKLAIPVIAAQSEADALLSVRDHPLRAALLEVCVEAQEAFSLARRLRELPGNEEMLVSFVSEDRRIETRVAALEAGGTRFFEKPLSEESLIEGLRHFLAQSEVRSPRVLLVDDDHEVRAQLSSYLRKLGMVTEELSTADRLIDALEETRPDVLILDVNLPRVSGIDICRALRMSERWQLLPILLATVQLDAETRLRAFRAGASDVISKPVVAEELIARVKVQEERSRLIRERADKDSLSGLLLRRALLEAFQRALATCARSHQPLSMVLLDIDRFKSVNDTYGHLAGDRVIAQLGGLLRRRFRIDDLRGRWGGEEFMLVFPGQGTDFAMEVAQRLLKEFSNIAFIADDGQEFHTTFTAGVAAFPEGGTSVTALIRQADALLYEGKRQGRGRVLDISSSEKMRAVR